MRGRFVRRDCVLHAICVVRFDGCRSDDPFVCVVTECVCDTGGRLTTVVDRGDCGCGINHICSPREYRPVVPGYGSSVSEMKQIAIVGAGSWGTALAVVAARAGHAVRLWSRNAEVVSSINERRVNSSYLSSTMIPEGVVATGEFGAALNGSSLILIAVPSHATRETLNAIVTSLDQDAIIVNVAKGIEIETTKRISEIVKEVVG